MDSSCENYKDHLDSSKLFKLQVYDPIVSSPFSVTNRVDRL